MFKDTDYSFCFQITNPDAEMPCKAVVITVKDSSISTRAAPSFTMTQDTGALPGYPAGSKCAGYTAPRGFTRATFRKI